jgi:hypothetical protein
MTILTWRDCLIRILQGLIDLPELQKNEQECIRMSKMLEQLKSEEVFDLRMCKKRLYEMKRVFEHYTRPLIIKERISQLDELFQKWLNEKNKISRIENHFESAFPIFFKRFRS